MTSSEPTDERAPNALPSHLPGDLPSHTDRDAGEADAAGGIDRRVSTARRAATQRALDTLLDALADSPVDVLPGGWYALEVPGVGHPLVIGPGGLFVLVVRHHSTLAIGMPHPGDTRPWTHDHRNQMSTPQITAELATQLVNWACGTQATCLPVLVVTGDDADVIARPDGVDVVHERMLTRWLAHLPAELDDHTIGLVLEHLTAPRLLPV